MKILLVIKRVVELSEIGQINGLTTGRSVYFDGVIRVTSQYMYDKLISENSKDNYFTKFQILGSVESVFKGTRWSGLSSELNQIFPTATRKSKNKSSSQIYKSEVKTNGEINLFESLKLNILIEDPKIWKNELNVNIDKVNGILEDIAKVNDKIQKSSIANDLLDKRFTWTWTFSNMLDIKVDRDDNFMS